MLIKFDEKYLTISSEITNYAKREEMEKIQQLCGEIVEVIKSEKSGAFYIKKERRRKEQCF